MECIHYKTNVLISPSFNYFNRIGGVLARMLTLGVVHRRFEYRSGHTKDYTIGICCFSD